MQRPNITSSLLASFNCFVVFPLYTYCTVMVNYYLQRFHVYKLLCPARINKKSTAWSAYNLRGTLFGISTLHKENESQTLPCGRSIVLNLQNCGLHFNSMPISLLKTPTGTLAVAQSKYNLHCGQKESLPARNVQHIPFL